MGKKTAQAPYFLVMGKDFFKCNFGFGGGAGRKVCPIKNEPLNFEN